MRPFLTVVWPLMLATRTSATTHDILVGLHGLSYAPNTTTAAIGDTVTFHFYPGPHNVVQSSFDTPCGWLEGGFYSGYISPDAGESPETFSITINDTSTIWIYCSSYMHCQSGMSMVINPGESGTLGAYIEAAKMTVNSTTPAVVQGGAISSGSSQSGSLTATATTASSSGASSTGSTSSSTASPTQGKNDSVALGKDKLVVSILCLIIFLTAFGVGIV